MPYSLSSKYFGGYLHDGKVGVMDIGSNSIRLVVYDGMKRVPLPIYNEKAFCSLAKGLGKTNKLNPDGVKMARRAVARLLAIVKLMEVVELHVVATAAIRDADDGAAFVKELERTHGVKIKIISGKREAKYAAYGILSSHHEAHGLAGDLGGGSMELIDLDTPELDQFETMPMGPLRLLDRAGDNRVYMRDIIGNHLSQVEWLKDKQYPAFYGVGGSFRSIATLHMKRNHYPLSLIHNYEVATNELMPMLKEVAEMPEDQLGDLAVDAKRQPQMPAAAMILAEVLQMIGAKKMVFSTSGIREGLLFGQLSPFLRKEDALISSCAELAEQNGRHPGYPADLVEWMAPMFTQESEHELRLRHAACMLSDLAWRIHRPFRAEWAYHRVLQSSLVGISHSERVALAAALYHRYEPRWKENWKSYALLSERQRRWAEVVGTAMSLGYYLSGGLPGNLNHSIIKIEKGRPKLRMNRESQPLQGESVDRRLDALATAMAGFNRG
jgi:exopolyphosphatase/guanosine-5'-triphosphate,3'-diphosphate pyrophosphatase